MSPGRKVVTNTFGRPIANLAFSLMHRQVRSIEKRGVSMLHTARPFSYYLRVFYDGKRASSVLQSLRGKTVVDIGCGYTPYSDDSMFSACQREGIEFYGVDPLIGGNIHFDFKDRLLARAFGSRGRFSLSPPGIDKAIAATAQDLPFADDSVDEILCSYLLFVWIEDQAILAQIFNEFYRVLKAGGVVKLYPLPEWHFTHLSDVTQRRIFEQFDIEQHFVHGGLDFRITPSLLTEMKKI